MNIDAHGHGKQSRQVLLVDDEKMVLEVGQAILQRLGHDVITALSGKEALEKFDQHRQSIGCVVLDLTMPGMDGKAVFIKLRELSPDLPIIVASGLTVGQVLAEFDDMQPTTVIQKPFQIAELSSKIEAIL